MGLTSPRMCGIMWNAWSQGVSSLSAKRGRSQDSQARMSDKVERVPHEEEGILMV